MGIERSGELTCFAHRGASGHEPENTLRAVRKAIALGAPWVEIDVQMAGEEIVVLHDATLDRTTDGSGRLDAHSFEQIRSLDAGKGEQIPLLAEVLELTRRHCSLNIELKGPGTALPTLTLIQKLILEGKLDWSRVLVSSFNHQWLKQIKTLEPDCPIAANLCGLPLDYAAFADGLGVCAVHLDAEFIDPDMVRDAHRRGYRVHVFTVNDRPGLEAMIKLGVDGVFTNYPELPLTLPFR